jgi:hypothetical protein
MYELCKLNPIPIVIASLAEQQRIVEVERPLEILKLPEIAHRFGSSDRAIAIACVDLTSGERVI